MVVEAEGKILSVTSNDMKANIYGDIAVLTGTQDSVVQLRGRQLSERQVFTDVFRYRRGHWLLVLAHSVELPAADSQGT